MALAKFFEDNMEIIEDRIRMNETERFIPFRATFNVTVSAKIADPTIEKPVNSNPVLLKRVCNCCGKEFSLKKKTILWFLDRGLHLPKRCRKCLNDNRKDR